MSSMKSLTNTFMLMIATLAITACVPKATEKKAICGTNQAFNTVTRSCYSIAELRAVPVGSVATVAMSEETPKTITLAYTDANKDAAVSCSISSISSNMEMMPPSIIDGAILDEADEVYQTMYSLAVEMGTSEIPMRDALLKAKGSVYFPTIVTQLTVFKAQVNVILLAAAGSTNSTIQYYYTLAQTRMATLNPMLLGLTTRCECSGGICTTVAVPKLHKSGSAGFAYTITDIDGTSVAKSVAVTITAMSSATAHLKPVAASSEVSFTESNTSVASSYTLTLPGGADITPTAPAAMRYYFNGSKNSSNQGLTTLGKVTGCMDLVGSDSLNDTTCIYTPNSGDAFDSIPVGTDLNATATIGDLVFTALAKGSAANSFNIQYYSLQEDVLAADPYASTLEKYGLVTNAYEAYIRVSGNAIRVFINPGVTTSAQIAALITAHTQANKMVTVTGGSTVTPGPSTLTPSPVFLTGGIDGFDKISYFANNTLASSTNAASVSIRMASVDDVPAMNYVASAAATFLEDPSPSPISINLSSTYSDVDTNASVGAVSGYYNTCNIDPTDAIFAANFPLAGINCTCVLSVCTMTITPNADVSSTTPFTFKYRIGSVDAATSVAQYTEYRSFSLTMTPVNDAPQISSVALPTITAIPAQTIAEGGTGYVDVFVGPGGSGFETSQTLTLTATGTNLTVIPAANLVVSDTTPVVAGKKRITFTPAANQSGTSVITLTLKDNGGVLNSGSDTTTTTFNLKVTPVNNPPVFISTVTTIETNEGGAVQSNAFQVDEDASGSTDENAQSITIDSIHSDNPSVLPDSAIKIFYDSNDNGVEDAGEARAVGDVLEGPSLESLDVKLHKFYLKLDPVDGISGNANIQMTISDHIVAGDPLATDPTYLPLTNSITTNFSFIVHPVAALHGGWNNISSVGTKTDKTGTPVTAAEIQCNYNKVADLKHCGTSDCTGTASPNGTIVPDAVNVIFWDSAAQRCYRSTAATAYSWVDFNTSCPTTRTATATDYCSGNNCIYSGVTTTYPVGAVTPLIAGQYLYNSTTSTCYSATGTDDSSKWQVYVPSKVTLSWKQFVMVGSGADSSVQITGWNVYRREAGTDYNFKGGHLKNTSSTSTFTIPDPSIRTFTDTTAVSGKVYYYVVRPVDNIRLFPTYTPELFSEVRVLASPANYSFVHRWIVNQEICNSMNITTTTTPSHVDQTNNFRCEYSGPGQTDISGTSYYDYGHDLLVDSQEAGCPYAAAPKCTANGCIGTVDPTVTSGIATNDLYYNRNTGTCHVYTGSAWKPMGDFGYTIPAVLANTLNTALNAPLVNLTQLRSRSMCTQRTAPVVQGFTIGSPVSLPNKKDYMGYSSQKLDVTDADISDMEQGFSLNIQSRCNSSAASGLETAFTDSSIPSTSFIYSLPGTFSSGIRSLYTGSIPWGSSKGTDACVSRFGIQDLYGNVAEWTLDQMGCENTNFQCRALATTGSTVTTKVLNSGGVFVAGTSYAFPANLASSFTSTDFNASTIYGFDLATGPFNDIAIGSAGSGLPDYTGPSPGDAFLTRWVFADQFFSATKFSLPVGMPISSEVSVPAVDSDVFDHLLTIGPSSGITTNKLHEDGIIINGALIAPGTSGGVSGTGSLAVGGSYLSGNLAGRYMTELIESSSARPDVGLRCIVPIESTEYPVDANHTYPY